MYVMQYLCEERGIWITMSGTNSEDETETEVLARPQLENWKKFGIKTETRIADIPHYE